MNDFPKFLSERNALLISLGVQATGNYIDGYWKYEKYFYLKESKIIQGFCAWLEKNHKLASEELPFTEEGYPYLYKRFLLEKNGAKP